MKDNIYSGQEALDKLMNGVRKVSNAVGITMGTSGSNSLVECIERPGHFSTNDGFTIANALKLADPVEEIGRKVLVEAINRANKNSGDGSSTTCVLTSAILEGGIKHLHEASPMEIKRSLEACLPLIEESLNKQKKEISVDEVGQVATISAEDEGIGKMIQEIYQKIGKDGVISWDISKSAEDSYSIGTGLTINDATYASPYMGDQVSDTEFSTTANLTDPPVLLCRQKITTGADFGGLFASLYEKGIKEIAIFCDEIEIPAIVHLILTQQKRGFRSVVIKMPIIFRDEWWEDLRIASGGKIIDLASGIHIQDVKEEHLGKFGHIKITREDTYIDGINDMSAHIAKLQEDGSDEALNRAARLNLKTARYFVGAHSESALAYRRLKVEDAINASSCALKNGVVAGGGIALANVAYLGEDSVGRAILNDALLAPLKSIIINTGANYENVIDDLTNQLSPTVGFDTKTKKLVDMFEAGIVDPTDVVLNAIKNAIGVAASILTTGTIITLPREESVPQMPSIIPR